MSVLIGGLITIIGISIVGIIMLIQEIHADADVISILNEMLDKQKQLNANLEATNDVMMQEVDAWESKYNTMMRESCAWESRYNSQCYITNKLSKTTDELTEKLKSFENSNKASETDSFDVDSSNTTQKYRF